MNIPIDLKIFRDYDIRGVYPTAINEETYYILGKAISVYLSVPLIAVGHDSRLSSPSLSGALIKGIIEMGVDVVQLGLISTEMHYFANGFYKYPANIIVSASHNPPQYNGLKIVKAGVTPLHGCYGLPEIKELAIKQEFESKTPPGKFTNKIIMDDWITHALSFIHPDKLKNLKVVVDAGNGMGGISWARIKEKLPLQIIPLFFEPDGHFPNHLPDPLGADNLQFIQAEIIRQKADIGFALDGDADRLFVLDENGKILSGTITAAMLAENLLKKYGPNTILYGAVCGRIVAQTIEKYGGTPLRVRVGHSLIKEAMKKENALFAGEHSGHFYFRQNFYADSSLIAGLLLLEYLSTGERKISDIVREFDIYPSSGEINFRVNDSAKTITEIEKRASRGAKIDYLDGLSVWYENYWFNLRASKTEPFLRLNMEADTKDILDEKLSFIQNELTRLGASINE